MSRTNLIFTLLIVLTPFVACEKKETCETPVRTYTYSGIDARTDDTSIIKPQTILSLFAIRDKDYPAANTCLNTSKISNGIMRGDVKMYCSSAISLPDITISAIADLTSISSKYFSISYQDYAYEVGYADAMYVAITKPMPNKELKEGLYTFCAEATSVNGNFYKDSTTVYLRY